MDAMNETGIGSLGPYNIGSWQRLFTWFRWMVFFACHFGAQRRATGGDTCW